MISESSAAKASYTASGGTTILGLFTLQEWAAIIGIFLAMATFAVNLYFQRRRDRREAVMLSMEQEEHGRRMQVDD